MRIIHNLVLFILMWGLKVRRGTYPFRQWIEMESKKEKIIKSLQDNSDFPTYLLEYISLAVKFPYKYFQKADWIRLVSAFYGCISKSPKVELPITLPSDEKQKEADWEYPNRTWNLYSHMLCKTYGWDLEYVANMDVFEALAHIQEIVVDEQLDREFYYGLSEAAYTYDSRSKVSKFNPLPRPHWMRKRIQPIKKFLIPANMLPFGVINPEALPDEYLPKEISKT